VQATLEAAAAGRLKLLFVTPECLAMSWVQEALACVRVSLACIDEAHYASETSASCRSGCLRIPQLLQRLAPAAVRCVRQARVRLIVRRVRATDAARAMLVQRRCRTDGERCAGSC
jgi:superfamily II DNA helicase RecQ